MFRQKMEVVDPTREVVDARLLEGSSLFFAEIKLVKLLCVFQTRKRSNLSIEKMVLH